jgi:Rieske Fe-S protein
MKIKLFYAYLTFKIKKQIVLLIIVLYLPFNTYAIMDRRKFLKATCAIGGVAVIGTSVFLESCKKDKKTAPAPQGPTVNFTLDLTKPENAALNTPGGSIASNGVLVIAFSSSYVGLAQSCTHQACNFGYAKNTNSLLCPCHGGTYDIDGKVTGGPPPAPLKKYSVTKNGTMLTIVG